MVAMWMMLMTGQRLPTVTESRPEDPAPNRPLHWRIGWQVGGLLLILGLIAASLLPPIATLVARGEDKLLHALAYAALMLYYAGIVRPRYYAVVALGLMALGIGIEFLQRHLGYRVADPYDVAANAVGLAAGLILGLVGLRGWARAVEARLGARTATTDDAYHRGQAGGGDR
jgi:VanZ family protein